MSEISKRHLVVHANCFATALDKKMTTVEQRFFAIYMSKLNPFDETTREVSLSLAEYERIMGIQRYNIVQIKQCARNILNSLVFIDLPSGGFEAFHVFSRFRLDKVDEEWMITINCSDEILPYVFGLKKEFMQYELWNVLNLHETNHQQLYRILKQYERIAEKTIPLEELKFCLGLDGKHEKFYDFRRDVLEPCQKALAEKTDIFFEYEPIRKGRKIYSIRFTIHKNAPQSDKPLLSEFVAQMAAESACKCTAPHEPAEGCDLENGFQFSADGQAPPPIHGYTDLEIEFLAEACDKAFSESEMTRIADALRRAVPVESGGYASLDFDRYHVLQTAYLEMEARGNVKYRANYLVKMLEAKAEDLKLVRT